MNEAITDIKTRLHYKERIRDCKLLSRSEWKCNTLRP